MSRLIPIDAVLLAYDYMLADTAHLAATLHYLNRNAGSISWLRPKGHVMRTANPIDWTELHTLTDYARNLIRFSMVWQGLDRKVDIKVDESISLVTGLGALMNLLLWQDLELEAPMPQVLAAIQDASRNGLNISGGWNESVRIGNVTKLFLARFRSILVDRQLPQDSRREWRRPGGRHRINERAGPDR